MRKFEDLRVWQDARVFVVEIYSLTRDLKDWGFKDQLQRAAVSIMNNIAEGSDAGGDGIFVRYLHISLGSCSEVKSMLYLCEDLHYCSPERANELRIKLKQISSSVNKLINYLKTE